MSARRWSPDCVARCLRGLAMVVALVCAPVVARAQEEAHQLELQVQAAFLVNFLRYTEWPPDRIGNPGDPYTITVVGDVDAADTLRRLAEVVPPIQGRRIVVQRVEIPVGADATVRTGISDRLRASHLVFVHGGGTQMDAILDDLGGQPVLTVGDHAGFAREGGMIELQRRGGRIAFDANPEAIRGARLVVSAKVLKLARIVYGAVR